MLLGNEILAVVTRGLLRAVEGRALDRVELLRAAGLSEAALMQPDAWLPIARHLRLGEAIAAAFPGSNVGLQTGAPIYSDPAGALGYCLRRSQVHRRALGNFAAYIETVNRAVRMVLDPEQRGAALVIEMLPELSRAGHPAEALVAAWVSISRYLTGCDWSPLAVEFVHQPFGDPEEHRRLFGCPVKFGHAETRLVLSHEVLSLAIAELPHGFDATLRTAKEHARACLEQDPRATADLEVLCSHLSTATLDIRELRGPTPAGGSGSRLALARALIERSGTFVHEAAYLLGFETLADLQQALLERFGAIPARIDFQN